MKRTILFILALLHLTCARESSVDIVKYHRMTNSAELLICSENYEQAVSDYLEAFVLIQKPFGQDVFNAALASQLSNRPADRDRLLQLLVNNSDDLSKVYSTFVGKYITEELWQQFLSNKEIDYDPALRLEFKKIKERDQLFRPMYDTYDDTINANRIINLDRILQLSEDSGFPSQVELGYPESLRRQDHDIVLHHTSQRRSRDKSITDLQALLRAAVDQGRTDPENAIFYLNMQNDADKRNYEVYSIWQHRHPELPDSLNNKIWLPDLTQDDFEKANMVREAWNADKLQDIAIKSSYISKSSLPFIFTSVRKSIANMPNDLGLEEAMVQYEVMTSFKKPYE